MPLTETVCKLFKVRDPIPEYPIPKTLAEKVKAVRRHRGWTQVELAHYLKVDLGAITRWERGGEVRKTKDRLALAKLFSTFNHGGTA